MNIWVALDVASGKYGNVIDKMATANQRALSGILYDLLFRRPLRDIIDVVSRFEFDEGIVTVGFSIERH